MNITLEQALAKIAAGDAQLGCPREEGVELGPVVIPRLGARGTRGPQIPNKILGCDVWQRLVPHRLGKSGDGLPVVAQRYAFDAACGTVGEKRILEG